jgi:DNA repair protein RecO (recombination protein O)
MQYLQDTGFVIKRTNFGEADRYITLFTKTHGKIDVVARGVRKITSRRASHIELLHLIRFQTVQGKQNPILTEAQLVRGFYDQSASLEQLSARFLVCELLNKLCASYEQNESVYHLVEKTLQSLEQGAIRDTMHTFQINLLTNLGYWDQKRTFYDEHDVRNFIEGIIEKRLKTKLYFEF